MKIFKIVLIVVFVAIGAAIGFVYTSTTSVADTGREFFDAVKAHDIDKAYSFLTKEVANASNKKNFEKYLKKEGLYDMSEVSLDKRYANTEGVGTLEGVVKRGDLLPVKVYLEFVKRDGWRISYIQIGEDKDKLFLQDEKAVMTLVKATTAEFASSVKAKSMKKLYDNAADLFKKQVSLEKFNNVYKSFFPVGDGLEALNEYTPAFDEKPSINENGVLSINGYYQVGKSRLKFLYKYIKEGTKWKLYGLAAKTQWDKK